MESFASKDRTEKEKKSDLKRQIAALQAQVGELDSDPESPSRAEPEPGPSSPKRRKLGTVLAPATPSPKKKRRPDANNGTYLSSRRVVDTISAPLPPKKKAEDFVPVKPAASTLLSMLASSNRRPMDNVDTEPLVRSSAFTDTPALEAPPPESSTLRRDERLALIEDLEPGPTDCKAPFDDPHFEQLEPNSGIRLLSRKVPHEDLQDHLRARYYLSPSRLYSAIRLLPDKQGYDVPVAGDWITIAVVAERGAYKYSKAPVEITRDEDVDGRHGKAKEPPKSSGKKYINMKLVDFGARSASSATGGKAVVRGDAMLSLLLFESDGWDSIPQDGGRPKKVYRGGSRGAFEEMCDLKEGDVIALLNPRVLKPFQRSNDTPHPTTNILAITPESAGSIMVIGRAKDLGLCAAVKRDGKACGSWCDKRVSDVCEWHVQNAVQQRRASRPEFSVGTSGMSTSARKQKPEYDPRRKWGLKPLHDSSSGGATYVVSGHIVGGGNGADSLFVSESMGRENQAKANRKLASREEARVLKALQGRDNEGMKAVMKAREVVGLGEKDGGKDNKKSGGSTSAAATTDSTAKVRTRGAFSAEVIKKLGFDPSFKPGQRRHEDSEIKKKMEELDLIQSSRKAIVLGLKGGPRIRSVSAPKPKPKAKKPVDLTHLHDLDSDSDSDMPASVSLPKPLPVVAAPVPEERMVDLDDF